MYLLQTPLATDKWPLRGVYDIVPHCFATTKSRQWRTSQRLPEVDDCSIPLSSEAVQPAAPVRRSIRRHHTGNAAGRPCGSFVLDGTKRHCKTVADNGKPTTLCKGIKIVKRPSLCPLPLIATLDAPRHRHVMPFTSLCWHIQRSLATVRDKVALGSHRLSLCAERRVERLQSGIVETELRTTKSNWTYMYKVNPCQNFFRPCPHCLSKSPVSIKRKYAASSPFCNGLHGFTWPSSPCKRLDW